MRAQSAFLLNSRHLSPTQPLRGGLCFAARSHCGCHGTRWGDHRLRLNRSRRGLRAVYVDAAYGGQGVGRALLARLEELARDAEEAGLRIDGSINAVPFYEANGFISLERGEHVMPSGGRMTCVRMRKALPS
jgi:GNAT superfamily N-acetyltransferase